MHRVDRNVIGFGLLLGICLPNGLAAAQAPVTVSPGGRSAVTTAGDRCPSFSWAGVAGARAYELAVFAIDAEGAVGSDPVIEKRIAGGALSWTPALERCLEAGGRYAWSIRAVGQRETSPWSAPSLFAVAGGSGEEEFREALAVVRRHLDNGAGPLPPQAEPLAPPALAGRPSTERAAEGTNGPTPEDPSSEPGTVGLRSEMGDVDSISFGIYGLSAADESGSAGLVGETTATAGETYGVIGRHAGGGGSGSAGAFAAFGGADVLRGFSDGVEVFAIDGAGTLTLPFGDFTCLSCVHRYDIAVNTIHGSEIANGSLTSFDIASDTITQFDMGTASVGGEELDTIHVVSVECNGECSDITLSQVCSVAGSNRRPIAVDCRIIDPDSGAACGGDNECFAHTVDGGDSLASFCLDGSGWDAQVYCLDDDG